MVTDKQDIERVVINGKLRALIVRSTVSYSGHQFISDLNEPLQIGFVQYEEGQKVERHYHPDIKRVIHENQEVLYVQQGGGVITIYDDAGNVAGERQFAAGDLVAFIHGGHKLEFFKETRVIQVKQGPYVGPERDKIYY